MISSLRRHRHTDAPGVQDEHLERESRQTCRLPDSPHSQRRDASSSLKGRQDGLQIRGHQSAPWDGKKKGSTSGDGKPERDWSPNWRWRVKKHPLFFLPSNNFFRRAFEERPKESVRFSPWRLQRHAWRHTEVQLRTFGTSSSVTIRERKADSIGAGFEIFKDVISPPSFGFRCSDDGALSSRPCARRGVTWAWEL